MLVFVGALSVAVVGLALGCFLTYVDVLRSRRLVFIPVMGYKSGSGRFVERR